LRDLIDLGGLSSLRPAIGTKHAFSQFDVKPEEVESFKKLTENMCTFYGRDRGEGESAATYFKDYEHFLVDGQEEEYDYILRNVNGVATWFVSDHGGDFQSLAGALIEEILENVEVLPL
jgi:hypothetical protein